VSRPPKQLAPSASPGAAGSIAARALSAIQRVSARQAAWALVWALAGTFAILVSYHVLYRHWEYHTDAFDLGNMDQAVWNTLHGHPFRFTNRGNDDFGPPTRLSIHVEPILLPLSLLYLIHSGPETLLVTQTLALALGALPLFALCLRRLPEAPFVGVALAAGYLLSPLLLGEALWDFHAVALATPLLIGAVLALDARRYGWFLVAAILAMATKEDVGLSVAILALILAVARPEKRRLGLLTALGALVWVAICFKLILPHYNVGVAGGNNYWYRYEWLGATPVQAVVNIFTKPWILFGYLFSPGRLYYLSILLRSAGGLGLLAPIALLAGLPDLAVNILSAHAEQYSGFFQYNAAIIPYLFTGAAYGAAALLHARQRREKAGRPASQRVALASIRVALLEGWRGGWRRLGTATTHIGVVVRDAWRTLLERVPIPARWLAWALVVWIVAISLWNLPSVGRIAPFWKAGNPPSPALAARMAQVDALLARIPATASVCATDTLDPHVSDRYNLYLAPDPQCYQADYVVMDLPNAIANVRDADTVMLGRMEGSGHYTLVGLAGQVILWRRTGAPLAP
jgi:uncharacterized membrane protein